MNKVKPEKFLEYAKLNWNELKRNNEEMVLINTYGCIAKGFHSQIDELTEYIRIFKQPKKGLIDFPTKFDFIKDSQLFAPEQILRLNKLRNDLEHRYEVPPREVVELALGYLAYFIRDAKTFMKIPAKEIKEVIDNKLNLVEIKRKKTSDSIRTLESYMLQAKKFFYFYGKNPDLLTEGDANNYLKKLIKEGYRPRLIQHIQSILNFVYINVLNKRLKWTIRRPPIVSKEHPILTKQEINEILELTSLRNQLIIRLIYSQDIKVERLVELQIKDIPSLDLPESYFSDLKKYLGNRKKGYIFTTKFGGKIGVRGIEWILQNISRKFGKRITSIIIKKSNPKIRYKESQINKERNRLPRARLKEEEVITTGELNLLLKNAEDELKSYYVYFIYNFGVGLNQFMNLKFEDIDFQKRIIKTKPAKHFNLYRVDLNQEVFNKLKEYCNKYKISQGNLFTYSDYFIRKIIKIAGKKAKINKRKLGYGVLANSLKFSKWYSLK